MGITLTNQNGDRMSDTLTHETLSTQLDTDPDVDMQVPRSSSPPVPEKRMVDRIPPVGERVPDTFAERSVSYVNHLQDAQLAREQERELTGRTAGRHTGTQRSGR